MFGWEAAIRGMRNPKNSWEKSDSHFCTGDKCLYTNTCRTYSDIDDCPLRQFDEDGNISWIRMEGKVYAYIIGPNDLDLMKKLRNAGTDHRKFMRMITVYVDITAPLYWWKEFDTYKVGTVANSCSTMHKIADKKFTMDDFSCEHLIGDYEQDCLIDEDEYDGPRNSLDILNGIINMLNKARDLYLETKDKKYWWQMIQLLPSSYNQKRTVMLNYEVLANIYKSRKDHKLDEWAEIRLVGDHPDNMYPNKFTYGFCDWIKTLPYSELITGEWS